ncbi:MAG: hypothetical protein ICV56_05945 [Nitrososphaeraceae archaeon]|nr:hypothetical protein [Nitrososphaeraceae archaeon]
MKEASMSEGQEREEQQQQQQTTIPNWHVKMDYVETCNCDYYYQYSCPYYIFSKK